MADDATEPPDSAEPLDTRTDTIRRANVGNIVRKLTKGKTLTRVELDALETYSDQATGMSVKELARKWKIDPRVAYSWKAAGVPMDDEEGMIEWYQAQDQNTARKLTGTFREKIEALIAEKSGGKSIARTADWDEFLAHARKSAEQAPKESLHEIMQARDFAAFRFKRAAEKDNRSDMKTFADLLAKFEGVVHDAELRAKKLGIDRGELLARPEVERIVYGLAYWSQQAVNMHLDALTSKLKALSPGLEGEIVRSVLVGELLSARFLEPFVRAASIQSGVGLPEWIVAQMRRACGDFLDQGEAVFDERREAAQHV